MKYPFILILSFISQIFSVEFAIKVEPMQKSCFGESVPENTEYVIQVAAHNNQQPYLFVIYDNSGKNILTEKNVAQSNDLDIKWQIKGFNTTKNEDFKFCVVNKGVSINTYQIKQSLGSEEADKNQASKLQHLEPVQEKLQRLNEINKDIKAQQDFMFENYEYRQDYVDNLLGRLLSTSILTVLLVLLLGVFEIIFFRRFFLYKKLI